jgi:hypothetical protein
MQREEEDAWSTRHPRHGPGQFPQVGRPVHPAERTAPKTNKAHGGGTPVSPIGRNPGLNDMNQTSEPLAKRRQYDYAMYRTAKGAPPPDASSPGGAGHTGLVMSGTQVPM